MLSQNLPRPAATTIASQFRFVLIAAVLGAALFGAGGVFLAGNRVAVMRAALVASVDREARSTAAVLGDALASQFPADASPMSRQDGAWAADRAFGAEQLAMLDQILGRFVGPTGIAKIKLFDRAGRTIYSPIRADLGRQVREFGAFAQALGNSPRGYLEFHERFTAADGERAGVWIVATYVALRLDRAERPPDAVAEFYADVTDQFDAQRLAVQREIVLLGCVLAVLFAAVLALVVWRQRRLLGSLQKLAESEAQFRDGMESMGDGFLLWDSRDRLVTWNQRCAELLPYSGAVFRVGLDFTTYIRDTVSRNHAAWSPEDREARVQERIRQHHGADRTLEFTTSTGRIIELRERRTTNAGRVSIFRDVTNERLAERRLADSEASFRDGVESMIDAFCMYDSEQRLLHWNTRYVEIFAHLAPVIRPGLTMREIFVLHAAAPVFAVPEAERETWLVGALLAATDANEDGYRRRLADGRVVWIISSATAVRGLIHVIRDVTAETRANEALTRNEARFREAIENMADGLALWDAEDRLILWNRSFARVLAHLDRDLFRRGTRFVDWAAANAVSVLPDADDAERAVWVEQRLAHRRSGASDVAWTTSTGRTLEIVERRTSEGGIVSVYRDVTEQRRATERIAEALDRERRASAHQKRFVSIAAHEFRTPLTIIDGAAQRLTRNADRLTPEELRERAHKIRAAASRMAQLVDTTLSLARLDDGKIDVHTAVVDLISLVGGICKRLEGLSSDFAIIVSSEVSQLAVSGDPRLLDQVFTNLVANAIKYSGQSQRVEVTLASVGSNATVAIRDHGIGIPADELPKLFTRFYRASTARSIPGTGIGLNLVRELLLLQGGEVVVASEVDRGSIFTVTLPRAVTDTTEIAAAVA